MPTDAPTPLLPTDVFWASLLNGFWSMATAIAHTIISTPWMLIMAIGLVALGLLGQLRRRPRRR
ncbi:hypothetical protein [Glaciibacter flavus]|uniref:hypothetical protein n=1 Tax=Orlajensenia flava TaxID=2565934 RepID=UPI003AFFA703